MSREKLETTHAAINQILYVTDPYEVCHIYNEQDDEYWLKAANILFMILDNKSRVEVDDYVVSLFSEIHEDSERSSLSFVYQAAARDRIKQVYDAVHQYVAPTPEQREALKREYFTTEE